MEALTTEERDGFTVRVYPDPEPSSPADWDTFGTLAGFSRSATRNYLGFEDASSSAEDAALRGGGALLARYLRITEGIEAVPFWFDDHGAAGSRIYASDDPNGYVYATRAAIIDEHGSDDDEARAKARALSAGELETWSQYFQGDVYGYTVTGPDEEHRDSLWGLYGLEYAEEEAREALSTTVADELEEAARIARALAL